MGQLGKTAPAVEVATPRPPGARFCPGTCASDAVRLDSEASYQFLGKLPLQSRVFGDCGKLVGFVHAEINSVSLNLAQQSQVRGQFCGPGRAHAVCAS